VGAAFGVGFITGPLIGGLASHINITDYFPGTGFLHPFSFCALISFILALLSAIRNFTSFQETLPESISGSNRNNQLIANPFKNLRAEIHSGEFHFITLIYFIFILMFSGFEFSLSFLYKLKFGLTPAHIGFVFLYSGIVMIFGQGFLVRRMASAGKEKKILLWGLLIMPLPLMFLAFTGFGILFSLLMLAPITLGASLVQPALSGIASLFAPAESQGIAMGSFRSAGSLARSVGPALGSGLFWFFGFQTAYIILTGFLFISVILALRIKKTVY
jgi:MFS family permease